MAESKGQQGTGRHPHKSTEEPWPHTKDEGTAHGRSHGGGRDDNRSHSSGGTQSRSDSSGREMTTTVRTAARTRRRLAGKIMTERRRPT